MPNLPLIDGTCLFEVVFEKKFGKAVYGILEKYLLEMANAYSQQQYQKAYSSAKSILLNKQNPDISDQNRLEEIHAERRTFADYELAQIPGSFGRKGSSASEQNHSSVISSILDADTKRYTEDLHVMIRDLLVRQKKLSNHTKKLLFGLQNKETTFRYTELLSPKYSDLEKKLLQEALNFLHFNSFQLFRKQFELSKCYEVINDNDNYNNSVIGIQKLQDSNESTTQCHPVHKLVPDIKYGNKLRCQCNDRISYLMMCRHEIAYYNSFVSNFFDIQHEKRMTTVSFDCGNFQIPVLSKHSGVLSNLSDVIEETIEYQTEPSVDPPSNTDFTSNNTVTGENNDEDEFDCSIDMEDNNIGYQYDDCQGSSSDVDSNDNSHQFLAFDELQNITNSILHQYKNMSNENKESVSAFLIHLQEFTKTEEKSNCGINSTNALKQIVSKFNRSFSKQIRPQLSASANNYEDVGIKITRKKLAVKKASVNSMKHSSMKQKMSLKESSRRKIRNKNMRNCRIVKSTNETSGHIAYAVKGHLKKNSLSKCSFCRQPCHRISNCLRRSELESDYQLVSGDYKSFIHYLTNEVPIQEPDKQVTVVGGTIENCYHIIVHNAYSIKKWDSYEYLDMEEMAFTVSLLCSKTAAEVKTNFVISGKSLENYIFRNLNNKNISMYDGTKKNKMNSTRKFHQRTKSKQQNGTVVGEQEETNQNFTSNSVSASLNITPYHHQLLSYVPTRMIMMSQTPMSQTPMYENTLNAHSIEDYGSRGNENSIIEIDSTSGSDDDDNRKDEAIMFDDRKESI